MAANISTPHVLKWDSRCIEVSNFEMNHFALSTEYSIEVTLHNPTDYPKIADFVCVTISDETFFGYVSFIFEKYSDSQYELRLELESPLKYFLKHPKTNVFSHCSLTEILKSLLNKAGFGSEVEVKIEFKQDVMNLWHQQINESSLSFFQKLMRTYNLFYAYHYHDNQCVCIFTDDLNHFINKGCDVELKKPTGLLEKQVKVDAQIIQTVQTGSNVVTSYDTDLALVDRFRSLSDDVKGVGEKIFHHARAEGRSQAYQSLSDEAIKQIVYTTDVLNLRPGQITQIKGDGISSDTMYVKSLSISGHQKIARGAKSLIEQQDIKKPFLSIQVHLVKYLSGQSIDDNLLSDNHPMIHTAYVEHSKSLYPQLSMQGRYHIRLGHDLASSASNSSNPIGVASHAVRNALYFAGNDYGLSMPLSHLSEVLVGYENDEFSKPVILGSLPNDTNLSVVTSKNRYNNSLFSNAGHEMTITEKKGLVEFIMKSSYQTEVFQMKYSEHEKKIKMSSKAGELRTEALKTYNMKAGKHIKMLTTKKLSLYSEKDMDFSCSDGTIDLNSQTSYVFLSQNLSGFESPLIRFETKKTMSCFATEQIILKSNKRIKISSLSNAIYMHTPAGQVKITARHRLKLSAGGSRMMLDNQSITCKTSGIIKLNALTVTGL